jgi:Holliday junction resolvase
MNLGVVAASFDENGFAAVRSFHAGSTAVHVVRVV